MRVTYNKLVRDRIPEMIEADGHHAVTRILGGRDYRLLCWPAGRGSREAQVRQLTSFPASWLTCRRYSRLCSSTLPMTWQEFQALAASKRDERGGFEERIFLEYTEQA